MTLKRDRRDARRPAPARGAAPRPPAPPGALGATGLAPVAAALLLAWLVTFAPQLGGRAFVIGDGGQYRPYSDFSRERFERTGERTFWNPYVFLGLPAAASLADARPQWLPGPALAAWDAATGTPWRAQGLLLAGLLAGALATAALARALFGCGPAGMALAGSVPLLSTAAAGPLAFGHDAQAWTFALTPVVLLATARFFDAAPGAARGRAAALAAAFAALAFAGHPQFLIFGALLAALLALALAAAERRPAQLAGFVLAAALGFALAAPAWLPALLYGGMSVRATPEALARDVTVYSGNVLDVAALFWPPAAGFETGSYIGGLRAPDFPVHVGAVVGLCAMVGAFAGRRARGAAWPWVAFALFAMAASLGPRLAPLQSALGALPVLGAFRTPITWLVPASLALALLAARGMTAFERGAPARRALAWALVVVAGAEMALVALPVLRRATGDVARLAAPPPPAFAVSAAGDSLHRAFAPARIEFFTNAWVAWRARAVGGLHGAAPAAWDRVRAAGLFGRERCLRAFAVRYLPGTGAPPGGAAAFDTLANGTLALRDALPRAYAASRVVALGGEGAVLGALAGEDFDARATAFTHEPGGAGEYPGSSDARIRWVQDDPDRQQLAVSAAAPAFVVVADAWAPGWNAHVDGREARLLRVNATLRGVALPAGEHALELRYRPPGWDAARGIAAAALLALAALALVPAVAPRARPPRGA